MRFFSARSNPKANRTTNQESPARRLGIMYVASLTAIAMLTAVSQSLILRELSWQGRLLQVNGSAARRLRTERSLSLGALAIQGATDPIARREQRDALRETIARIEHDWQTRPSIASGRGPSHPAASVTTTPSLPLPLREAIEAAKELLDASEHGSAPEIEAGIVRRIAAAEEAFRRSIEDAILHSEHGAAEHLQRLETIEFIILMFVLGVLLLEGLYVIGPAVRRIQLYMEEMDRSHEETKAYAARLEQSNRELQDFASVASHDLQEPLRKVQAFSDRLRSKYREALDDQARDYLDRIQNAGKRMQTLINDLLTYSRVTTKAQPFVPTDLDAATREVISDLEARIEQVGGRVELGNLPTLEADPLQIRQLMQNLIGNALKYHRPEMPPVVKVSGVVPNGQGPDSNGAECLIRVEDNGIGFEEVYAERIFTIFQRLHGRNEFEGTGVGLAVCRKIVERHGGRITARSTPGQGSTFLVTLPIRQPRETTPDGNAC